MEVLQEDLWRFFFFAKKTRGTVIASCFQRDWRMTYNGPIESKAPFVYGVRYYYLVAELVIEVTSKLTFVMTLEREITLSKKIRKFVVVVVDVLFVYFWNFLKRHTHYSTWTCSNRAIFTLVYT